LKLKLKNYPQLKSHCMSVWWQWRVVWMYVHRRTRRNSIVFVWRKCRDISRTSTTCQHYMMN